MIGAMSAVVTIVFDASLSIYAAQSMYKNGIFGLAPL